MEQTQLGKEGKVFDFFVFPASVHSKFFLLPKLVSFVAGGAQVETYNPEPTGKNDNNLYFCVSFSARPSGGKTVR